MNRDHDGFLRPALVFLGILIASQAVLAAGRPDVRSNWQVLAAKSNVPVAVTWSARTGTPDAMYGAFTAPGDASERLARQFLSDNADVFAMHRDVADLELVRDVESPLGRHYTFAQTYKGVPVYATEVSVHYDRSGRVVAVNNRYLPAIELDSVEPAIDSGEAIAMAEHRIAPMRRAALTSEAELVIVDHEGAPRLAWRVVTPTDRRTWQLFVDARNGARLGEPADINRYVNGTGQIFNVNAVVATLNNTLRDNNDAASAVPAGAYSTATLQGLAGTGYLDGSYASSSKTKKRAFNASNTFNFNRSQVGFSETMGYYFIDVAQRYIQSLGFTNVNNRQQVFSANGTTQDNSFYSPSTKQLTFGTGGVDDAEDAEVILHEYGHSIQDNQKPGFGSGNEAGAMGEGFGDYWGASVGAQTSAGFQDACIMDWDATSYSSANPPCLRRLDTNKHYPQSVVGQVHADGEIWSGALWQIRGAIGAAKADKVILQHHFLVNANATFNQAANALVTAAINLGYTASEVLSIRQVLTNRGFTVTV
ncbi:MAG TPA: M36 family metallopeptidase [Thermoanaerobaculia bacterium]|nr:M36 family metallopeptidase [Thermoanaerobaculia bacterium]